MVAGSMLGLASKSKLRRDFSRGKPAALISLSNLRRAVAKSHDLVGALGRSCLDAMSVAP